MGFPFFNWVQSRFNGNQKPHTSVHLNNPPKLAPEREELSDWPHGLLTIGTLGNSDTKNHNSPPLAEIQTAKDQESPTSSPDLSEFTPEEVGQLQKELTKLLKRKSTKQEQDNPDLPLDRFLNCPSRLEVSRRISNAAVCTDSKDKEDDIERTISVIIGKCKEVRAEKSKNNSIGKKSLNFLLNKFVCASGFGPTPSLRDPLQESRMEKLLRTILRKKIYPQNTRASSMKRYLEDKQVRLIKNEAERENETEEKARPSEGCKWVKTDSEYIVLEI